MKNIRLFKIELWVSMVMRKPITIQNHSTNDTFTDIVNKIEIEDGSGSSFIITLMDGTRLWHRTKD